jgi:hypothetical protein
MLHSIREEIRAFTFDPFRREPPKRRPGEFFSPYFGEYGSCRPSVRHGQEPREVKPERPKE